MSVLLRGFLSVPLMVLTCENKEIISSRQFTPAFTPNNNKKKNSFQIKQTFKKEKKEDQSLFVVATSL